MGIDSIMLSTDDMRFCADIDEEYSSLSIFDYNYITEEMQKLLLTSFNFEEVKKIMYENAYNKIINNLKSNKKVLIKNR